MFSSSKPGTDRYRNRSHSASKSNSNSHCKTTVNLTQQPTPLIHKSSSTEPKYELNMYHPNLFSCSQYFTFSNKHANAITPSALFVIFYIFKPPEDTSLPSKVELLFLLDSSSLICTLNLINFS